MLESSDDAALPTSTPTLGGFGGVPSGTPMRANPLFGVASAPTPPKAAEPAAPAPSLFSGFGAAVVASVAVTEKPSLFPNAATNPFGAGAPAPGLFGAPGAAAFSGFGGFGGGAAIAATSEGGDAEDEDEARPPSPSFKDKERGDEYDGTGLLKDKAKMFTQ